MDFHDDVTSYLARLKAALDLLDTGAIARLAALLADALDTGRDVFIFGNGGSAANASHITVDLAKGASYGGARRLRWHCLCDNVPVLTAYANDVGYDAVFVEPLRNLLRPGDLVIAMSGSGNSRNVIRAVEYAREVGASRPVGLVTPPSGRRHATRGGRATRDRAHRDAGARAAPGDRRVRVSGRDRRAPYH
jgi:D-sedoheptulose 7-phosphate isomerase